MQLNRKNTNILIKLIDFSAMRFYCVKNIINIHLKLRIQKISMRFIDSARVGGGSPKRMRSAE